MNSYWLYLEPYTMVFEEKEKTLIYNTLSGESLQLENGGAEYALLRCIVSPPDIYLLQITEEELREKGVTDFVSTLQSKFFGELVDCRLTTRKPVILYPKLNLMHSAKKPETMGKGLLTCLQKLIIQITGKCSCGCPSCGYAYRQIHTCNRLFGEELDFDSLTRLIVHARQTSVKWVDIIGGNAFSYTALGKLLDLMKSVNSLSFRIKCMLEHLNGITDPGMWEAFQGVPNLSFTLQCSGSVEKSVLEGWMERLEGYGLSCQVEFLISSEEDYERMENVCESLSLERYVPVVLLRKEYPDFVQNLYSDAEDILSTISTKKDIFRRQSLNVFDFGTLVVLANGDAYGNLNFESIGNVCRDELSTILMNEIEKKTSWFRIRDGKPCNDCMYRWLCPSPSNYELVTGRCNLCHVK